MTGGQIVLVVLAAIVLFFILILSIPLHVTFSYDDKVYLSVRYLFLKFSILPFKEKDETEEPKKEKKKKKKKKKPKKEPEKAPEKEEKPKEKKPNPILEMVKANGYDGMMTVLGNLGRVLGRYGNRFLKSFVFDELACHVTVGKGDAAQTAISYGQTCQKIYPLFGFLCANSVVRKYDVAVDVDFLANKSVGGFYMDFHLVIRKLINATVAMLVRLVFKVALKFLSGAKKGKADAEPQPEAAAQAAQKSIGSKMKG